MALSHKTTRDALTVVALLGILLALLPRLLHTFGMGAARPAPPAATPSPSSAGLTPAAVVEAPSLPATYTAEAAARRDPMVSVLPSAVSESTPRTTKELGAPLIAKPKPTPTLSVQGMIWHSGRPQALINGAVYDVGQAVDGARIIAIERRGVTVEWDGTRALIAPGR
jgi:hypothetical protein